MSVFNSSLRFVIADPMQRRNLTHLGYVSGIRRLAAALTYVQATRWDNYLRIFDPKIRELSSGCPNAAVV